MTELHAPVPAIERARAIVAARYVHDYHKQAILSGQWDSGELVAETLQAVLADDARAADGDDRG